MPNSVVNKIVYFLRWILPIAFFVPSYIGLQLAPPNFSKWFDWPFFWGSAALVAFNPELNRSGTFGKKAGWFIIGFIATAAFLVVLSLVIMVYVFHEGP